MKKLLNCSVIILSLLFTCRISQAQVSVSVNIGLQPEWGPVGYDYVDYYYLPDYEVYYDVPQAQFVYFEGGRWIFARSLPGRFGRVDLFSSYKVVINEPKAYMHFKEHQVKYVNYKNSSQKQGPIRDSKDPKYVEARKNPGQNNSKAAPAHSNTKATPKKSTAKAKPQPNSTKATPDHSNTKEKQPKKDKHPQGGQPHQ